MFRNEENNNNALIQAVKKGYVTTVKLLVEQAKADVNVKDNYLGSTPLHLASGRLNVAQYLVEQAKADVNVKTDDGWTPLHKACYYGFLNVTQYLVEQAKADVNVKNNDGRTPLDLAQKEKSETVLSFLTDFAAKQRVTEEEEKPKEKVKAQWAPKKKCRQAKEVDTEKLKEDAQRWAAEMKRRQAEALPAGANVVAHTPLPVATANASRSQDCEDEKIVLSHQALKDVYDDPTAQPAHSSLEYIQACTNNFTSKVLGKVAFGKVYLGADMKLGIQFAVKRVPLQVPDSDAIDQISRDCGTQTIPSPQHCSVVWV